MSTDKDLQRGFNQGYILQKNEPKLARQLSKSFDGKTTLYELGFIKGCEEYQKENLMPKNMSYILSKSKLPSKKEPEKDRTKDR